MINEHSNVGTIDLLYAVLNDIRLQFRKKMPFFLGRCVFQTHQTSQRTPPSDKRLAVKTDYRMVGNPDERADGNPTRFSASTRIAYCFLGDASTVNGPSSSNIALIC